MHKIERTAAAFDTEQALVGGSVVSFCIHDLAVFYDQIILAACGTVGTGGQDFLLYLPGTIFLPALRGQSACRTCLHTVSAGFAGPLIPVIVIMRSDHRLKSSVQGIDSSAPYDLVTGVHTSVAQDTFALIICKEFIGIIYTFIVDLALIAGHLNTVLEAILL